MTDESDTPDNLDNPDDSGKPANPGDLVPWPRWLRFRPACQYVGITPGTMSMKLGNGSGPKYRLIPGSRVKIFHPDELDRWITEAVPAPMSDGERSRQEKLQAGARRMWAAWRQAKSNEKADA